MYLDRLGGLTWMELVLAVGLTAATGATIAGTPATQALLFAGLATLAVGAYIGWVKGPTALPPAASETHETAAGSTETARMSRLLQSADAELRHAMQRLGAAEVSAVEHGRVLQDLGNLVLPRLQRAEREVQALLDARGADNDPTTNLAERRGYGGQALSTLRETEHLMQALLTLGRAEAETQPLRPERLDLRKSLSTLMAERGDLRVGLAVPTLLYCDRGLFVALIEQLLIQAESAQLRPTLVVDAEPRRGDMVLLTIQCSAGHHDRAELAEAVRSGDAMRAAAVLLRESGGEASLALPLALHAAARLGAKCLWQVDPSTSSTVLSLSILMTVAPDRRLSERPMVLADLGLKQHTSG